VEATVKLKTISQLVQDQPGLTEGGLRWDVFNARTNGLDDFGAVIRKGRRVYIDEDAYLEWLKAGGPSLGKTAEA
jgi:hypothetical protein